MRSESSSQEQETSERQPSDKAGARGRQLPSFLPGEACGTQKERINGRANLGAFERNEGRSPVPSRAAGQLVVDDE